MEHASTTDPYAVELNRIAEALENISRLSRQSAACATAALLIRDVAGNSHPLPLSLPTLTSTPKPKPKPASTPSPLSLDAGRGRHRRGPGAYDADRPQKALAELPRTPAFRWAPGEADRLSLLPIRHPDIWAFRKKIEALNWNAQEVDLTKDKLDWVTRMNDDERHYVKYQLAFFTRVDIDVLDNLDANFGEEVDCLEAKMAYAAQKNQECVHAEAYNLQIEALMSGEEREEALNAVRTMPIIGRMRAWILTWFDRALPIGDRLVAFGVIEGVMFQGPFAGLQWLRERNLLPGVTEFNTFICRDEGIHTLLDCLIILVYLLARPSQERAEAIFASAIELIDYFVEEALPVRLIGMNVELMKQYVRFQADCVLRDMGYLPMYRVGNPFPFMDKLTLNEVAKTNFFEKRATQYQSITKTGATRLIMDASPVEI
jgi:ribonucleotide reductase beta subunit family protein with ferritin-like domain